MATTAQINANRSNAAFSTGPRTPEGKAASARNATKHGLASAFRVLAHEDQEEFDRLLEQLRAHYLPADVISTLARYAAQAERSFHKAHREINAAKQRQLEAVCRPRLTMSDMRRVLKETPRVAHPSRPAAAQNEPNSPEEFHSPALKNSSLAVEYKIRHEALRTHLPQPR